MGFPGDRARAGRTDQARPDDGQDRAARVGRHRHGKSADHVSARTQLHAGRPQNRTLCRRQRRQPGAGQEQDPGTRREGPHQRHDRPARGRRGAGDRRLHTRAAAADPVGRRGRGHDAAQTQPVVRARHLDFIAVRASARGLLLQDAQVPAHGGDRRRHSLRPRDVRGLPARVRGARRQDRAENCSRRSPCPIMAPSSRN